MADPAAIKRCTRLLVAEACNFANEKLNRCLAPRAFREIFTATIAAETGNQSGNSPAQTGKSESDAAFHLEFADQPAQNPVTALWTACTRLKTNEINWRSFH